MDIVSNCNFSQRIDSISIHHNWFRCLKFFSHDFFPILSLIQCARRYFYGRIISYDSSVRQHSIVYEDGDVRAYDLTAKEFDIIFPPQHLDEVLAHAESDADK